MPRPCKAASLLRLFKNATLEGDLITLVTLKEVVVVIQPYYIIGVSIVK